MRKRGARMGISKILIKRFLAKVFAEYHRRLHKYKEYEIIIYYIL